MAISQAALAKIIQHNANGLLSKQGRQMTESKASRPSSMNDDLSPDEYSDQFDNFSLSDTSQDFEEGMTYKPRTKMPNEIVESMMKNPIDTSALATSMNDSPIEAIARKYGKNAQQMKSMMTEGGQARPRQTSAPQMASPQPQLDYTVLKGLIKECLSEYFKSNPILNESKGGNVNSMAYSEKTNKVRIIKENGDIYGGKLEYQGNVNDKKDK